MGSKADDRRRALRESLIRIAEARIAADGLSALRARDLATDAGCALGAIYTVFGDLTDLVLAVNARTFSRLGAMVSESLASAPNNATEQLVVMAQAYHRFAAQHHNLWRALFDVARPVGTHPPDWYLADMARLLSYISDPLRTLFPQMPATDLALLTRALFSSVHGIVLLGLDQASVGVPQGDVDRMIALVLRQIIPHQTAS